jgi:O-antigen/teichoic acid export membrane protein
MKLFRNVLSHELVSGSFYIFAGSMISNVLAFFLNLYLARNLSYADYAIFASLLSVITLASIPAGSINTIIVKFATDYFVKNQNEKLKALYTLFFKFILGFCLGIISLFFILSIPISNYLHISNLWYVLISGFVISAFYLNILNTAFLQSLMKFKFISFVNAIGGVIKLIFGVFLVILGYKAFSGLWSIFFMTFGMFLVSFVPLRNLLTRSSSKNLNLDTKDIKSYALPAFITILFLTSFTSTDVILVKHFFDPHLAGYYAGLSLIGKVIFYFTAPIPMVMFPLLVKRHASGSSFNNLFYLALILVILPSLFITAFYFFNPNFVINLFLGGREYLYVAPYLGIFGFYLTIFSMVNVCVNFFLSLNKTNISYLVIFAAVLQVIAIYLFHSSFYQVIGVSLIILIVLLLLLLFLFFKYYGDFKNLKDSVSLLNNPLA